MVDTATLDPPARPPASRHSGVTLQMEVRLKEDGEVVEREIVQESDLTPHKAEVWLHGCLRQGLPDVAMEQCTFKVLPPNAQKTESPSHRFRMAATLPAGKTVSLPFTTRGLSFVASRAAKRLLAAGVVTSEDTLHYGLELLQLNPARAGESAAEAPKVGHFVIKSAPPPHLSVPLAPLMKDARQVGETDALDYPVFYTEEAYAAAERFARRGTASNPPVETGCVLIGPLCACPETKEFFSVITTAIEASDAEEDEYAMTYSARTWQRIGAVVKALRSRPATRAHRILGQAHGHNFLPAGGAAPCEACHAQARCSRTTVYVSTDDITWSRSVFCGEPWGLCHIHGRNARGEDVNGLFGMRDGTLMERGFHILPSFSPPATPAINER